MSLLGKEKKQLTYLSNVRENERARIARDIGYLRESLRPRNLLSRITKSASGSAEELLASTADKARANPGVTAVIGGTILAVLLFRPAKSAITAAASKPGRDHSLEPTGDGHADEDELLSSEEE